MCVRIAGFQMPGIIYIILYCKNVCNYITYDVHIKLHKTRGWSPTPFLIYTFETPGCGQMDGFEDWHKYSFIYPEFLYTHYLHIY